MNTHHIDVWLERLCQLIAVALSFATAFYLALTSRYRPGLSRSFSMRSSSPSW